MKKLVSIYLNWRMYILSFLVMAAFLLLVCESEDFFVLLATKVAAILMGQCAAVLFTYWNENNMLPELSEVVNQAE